MACKIEIHHTARKQLLSLPKEAQLKIIAAIDRFIETPGPVGCKKLRETGLWRTRVERYRIVYSIAEETRSVTIVKVAIRQEDTYRKL